MKCLILAAGYATRLYPLTENFPKPLLKVGEKSILDWLVDDLVDTTDIDEFVVISNHKFAQHFEDWKSNKKRTRPYEITVIDDGTSTNETRLGAVKDIQLAVEKLNLADDLLVMAGDNVLDQLISHLTAVYEQFTRGQVKPVIKELFKQQYLLKVWETIEIRTRMETRVGIRPTIDAFGNISMETYTYQEEVEYEYKILNVLLKNKGFDTIARKNMNRKQTGRYDAYNLTYGNRPELFGAGSPTYSGGTTGSIGTGGGTGGSGGGFKYDIPSEALSDEKFARMIEEAEKYLGMPYVWGGSSPSTSFDCSGFVCWVINNCGNGWSVGRTTANGLRGKCSYVSPADAQPGDLIFFEKTYNTVGASHVGIYVGNGMMIHCGDPISYTSINSTYWQSHFLGFGRIN